MVLDRLCEELGNNPRDLSDVQMLRSDQIGSAINRIVQADQKQSENQTSKLDISDLLYMAYKQCFHGVWQSNCLCQAQ